MPKNSPTIAIYTRKSKFTGKGESIGNQLELCREYVRVHFGEATANDIIVFEDEGFSGGNLNRPAFKKMMEAAQAHQMQTIVVYRLDRISRNISDFASLIEQLGRLDIAFVSIREQFDTSNPMGRAMMYIASVFSQLERETIAERIRDNMHELAKTGRWLGGTTPTGYTSESVQSVTVDGKTKKACKLKLIPEEAEIVRKVFALYATCNSLTLTESALLQQGIRTKTGRDFTRFAIKSMLQNPAYLIADAQAYQFFVDNQADLFSEPSAFDGVHGMLAYNRTDQQKGRATIQLPVDQWIVSVGQHEGIIDSQTWLAAQQALQANKVKGFRRPRRNEALLTGLLYCGCGHRMSPKLTARTDANGEFIYSYVCKMKERSRRSQCDRPNAYGNSLDRAVVATIKTLSEDSPTFATQLAQCKRFYTGNREAYDATLTTLQQEQVETLRKVESLVDLLIDAGDRQAKTHIMQRIEDLHETNEQLTLRIAELQELTAQQVLEADAFALMEQMLSVFTQTVDDMSLEEKRAAIRTIVRKVVWDGNTAHMVLFGADEGKIIGLDEALSAHIQTENALKSRETNTESSQLVCNNISDTNTPMGEDSK